MKGRTLYSSIVLIGALLFHLSGEGFAGVTVEQVVRDQNGVPSKTLLYLSDHQYRTDHQERGLTTVLDFKEDRLLMIDHRSKNYVEVKISQWEKDVARRLKEESPGVKLKDRKIIVKKTGKKAVINGYQTEQVEILAGGELIEENWVTRDVEMKEIEQVMDRVAQGFSKDFRHEMKEGREIYEKLKPYGFPVLIKDYTMTYGLGAIDRVEVKKIEKKDLKEEVFLPPPGYQKIVPELSKK
ncbi:MAG: DUF4412 domain-containing protein [Desulfobacterales bacterium]|nr:DUF4412 domain-containing protein [Desulfobacterales bacterium]